MIDFGTLITDFQGNPLRGEDGELSLGAVCVNALLGTLVDAHGQPEQLSGLQKYTNATLAEAIFTAVKPVALKAEDIAQIKERIGRAYGSLIVRRAWSLLDPGEAGHEIQRTAP